MGKSPRRTCAVPRWKRNLKKCSKSKSLKSGSLTLILGLGALLWTPILAAPAPGSQKEEHVRGRIVYLEEELQKSFGAAVPSTHEHLYGFKTSDGKYFT